MASLIIIILSAGCTEKQSGGAMATNAVNPNPNQNTVTSGNTGQYSGGDPTLSRIVKMESRITSLEEQAASLKNETEALRATLKRIGVIEPSKKKLIPEVPFRIEANTGEWRIPLTYTFKDNGELYIKGEGDGDQGELASYALDRNNNTIKIKSKKYLFYGLTLYDEYATAIYENGQIGWTLRYKIIAPTYNQATQRYELN